MPFPWQVPLAIGALAVATAAGVLPVSATSPAAKTLASGAAQVARSGATARSTQTRLEVWVGPNRIAKIKPGRSRTLTVEAVETMAVWESVRAVVRARTTAGKILPKRALTRKGHPAKFRLTRTRGSTYGFVTFTATSRKYGTAKRNISWGKVRLPRNLTGTLTYVSHDEWREAGVPYMVGHTREQWHATFRLVSRSSRKWFGAALYRLAGGTWRGEEEFRASAEACSGRGQGPAAAGSLRYDWLGTRTSSGAGLYWLDLSSTATYRVHCTTHEYDSRPSFTLGFDPATNGVRPDRIKGHRHKQDPGSNQVANAYESWTWDLRAS